MGTCACPSRILSTIIDCECVSQSQNKIDAPFFVRKNCVIAEGNGCNSLKVVLDTLGCKLNQAESESLTWKLAAAGHRVVVDVREADVYVLNTCTVTAAADAKARQRLSSVHHRNPRAMIVVTGCYAERDAPTVAALPGVGFVVSNRDKSDILSVIEKHSSHERVRLSGKPWPEALRTRAFVKVQDGCSGNCAYCIVPRVRPNETSIPVENVLCEISQRLANGVKEIVLTGTEVGAYRSGPATLHGLLKRVLAETRAARIRLSSLQPSEISTELLSLWTDRRLCPHFHLSLQSGSDATLRSMRRRYSVEQYSSAVARIRSALPDAAISTDVIVGFPGETEEMFEESLRTCREMQFARIHVFPFSPRPRTEAASLPGRVDERTKRLRMARMLSLARESAETFRSAFKGKTRSVLWEQRDSKGRWTGFTDNYISVNCEAVGNLENTIADFCLD